MNKYIRVVFQHVNISSLIFLKLFDNSLCNKVICKASRVPYPVHYLLYRYGLKMCYISDNLHRLILVFDKNKCLDDLDITSKQYFNVIDLLVDSQYYFSMKHTDSFIIVELSFDKKYLDDIKMISETSKYSKVSPDFKKAMEPISKSVPYMDECLMKYIIIKNIPLGIVSRGKRLKEYFENFLREKLTDDSELYIIFNKEREFISDENLDKLKKIDIFDVKS